MCWAGAERGAGGEQGRLVEAVERSSPISPSRITPSSVPTPPSLIVIWIFVMDPPSLPSIHSDDGVDDGGDVEDDGDSDDDGDVVEWGWV